MRKVVNECVGCSDMGLPCLGSTCRNRHVIRWYCDECGEETTLYEFDEAELCIDCIIERVKENLKEVSA